MPYGRGYGMGGGFRNFNAPWPYIGRGRGGLPRCGYIFAGQPYLQSALNMPASSMDAMQSAVANLRERLAQIHARINALGQQKTA